MYENRSMAMALRCALAEDVCVCVRGQATHLPGEATHDEQAADVDVEPRLAGLHAAHPPIRHASQVHSLVVQGEREHQVLKHGTPGTETWNIRY